MFLNSRVSRTQKLWLARVVFCAAALGGSAARADAPSAADKVPASISGQHVFYVDYTPLMAGETGLGQPLVHVKINGTEDAVFLVDTGFTSSVITTALAAKLSLPCKTALDSEGKPRTWRTAAIQQTTLPKMQLGQLTYNAVPLLVAPPSSFSLLADPDRPSSVPIDGVLGINALAVFPLLLDGPQHKLGFCTPGTPIATLLGKIGLTHPATVSMKAREHGWFVSAQFSNGSKSGSAEMLVDTGSNISSLSSQMAQTLGLTPIIKMSIVNLDGTAAVGKTRVSALLLGTLELTDQPLTINPPLPPPSTVLVHDPSPLLGMDILSSYRVLLDFPGGKVYLQPPPSLLPEAGSAYRAEKPGPDTEADRKAKALVEQGVADATAGHVDLAFTKYNQVLALDPANVGALTHRSLAYSNTGKMDLALADARQAVLLAPGSAEAHDCLGVAFAYLGKMAEALPEFRQAITDMGPATPKAQIAESYFNLGVACGQPGDTAQAIAAYTQAVALDPTSFKSYINRGSIYDDLGDAVRAIADNTYVITQAPPGEPLLAAAYSNRGLVYARNGEAGKAIADFDQAIAHNPNFVMAYAKRGKAYLTQNKTAQAISDFTQAIVLAPNDAENYYNRGVARTKSDPEGAVADFTQTIQLDPKYASAYINRGNLYDAKKDENKAIADATRALTILPPGDPRIAFSLYNRSLAYAKKGDKEKAAADRAQAFRLNPSLEKLTTAK